MEEGAAAARGRKAQEASGGEGRRGPEGCWKGLEGAPAQAGREHLDAYRLCSQLSNVPGLPGYAWLLPLPPSPSPRSHIRSSGAAPHPTFCSPEPRHTPPTSAFPQRRRLMKPRPGKKREKTNRRGQGGRQEAGQGLGVLVGGSRGRSEPWGVDFRPLCPAGLMRPRWSLGWGPLPGATDSVSGCRFRAGRGGEGALQPQGRGWSGWPGAQHITLGRLSLGRSLGQQTPSRLEPSWQHEGTGLGRGPQGHRGLNPPCREDPCQAGGCEGTGLSPGEVWRQKRRPGAPGRAGSSEGQMQRGRGLWGWAGDPVLLSSGPSGSAAAAASLHWPLRPPTLGDPGRW